MHSHRLFHVFKLLISGYRQTPLTIALVFIALLVGCAGLTSVLVINDAAKQSYANINQPLITNVDHLIVATPGTQLSQSDYSTLRIQGFTNVIAVAQQQLELGEDANLSILGIDYFAILSELPELASQSSFALPDTRGSTQARYLIDPQYAQQLSTRIYLRDRQTMRIGDNLYGPVQELSGAGLGKQLVTDIATLYEDFPDASLAYLMVAESQTSLVPLRNALPSHLTLQPVMTGADANELTDSFHLNLLAMGLLMFVVCLFVIMNALHLLMSKRIASFKILRQLGISNGTLVQACIVEMLTLSLIAAVIGVLLGVQIANWLSPAVNQTITSLYSINMAQGELSLTTIFLQSLAACVLGSLIAISLPLYRINQNLAVAANTSLTGTSGHLWAVFAGLCLLSAGLLVVMPHGLLWSFISIALLIVGGCFAILALLPISLSALHLKVPPKFAVLHWSLADALRISHRSSIALCAFFIAVTANVGMNIMVESFRQATYDWLAQRLDADAYVYAQQAEQIKTWLDVHQPEIETVIRRADTGTYNGEKVQIRSFPIAVKRQKSMAFDTASTDVWQRFNASQSVLINQQFALSQKLQLEDKLIVNRTSGDDIELTVAGIYFDYGNPQLQILVPPNRIQNTTNDRQIIAIYANDSADDLDGLKSQLSGEFPQANIVLNQELLALSMFTFDRTFIITTALNLITLLVAAFSLATSVLIIEQDNAPQRALLKSMGVSSRSLLGMAITQYSILCLFICLLAIPFGIGLSWLLVNLVNVQAFFWSYPLSIHSSSLLKVILISLVLVITVVAFPAFRSARSALSQDIKWLQG